MATDQTYRVLLGPVSAELKEKSSRFLALIAPIESAEDAIRIRREFESRHHDATHHCWAELIGWPAAERRSDAGEPAGTAGEPILRVLKGSELSNVVGVVARWYGGTKLGKGGLARAYSGAVRQALDRASTERRYRQVELDLRLPYERLGAIKRLIRTEGVEWIGDEYGVEVAGRLVVRVSCEASVREALAELGLEVRGSRQEGS